MPSRALAMLALVAALPALGGCALIAGLEDSMLAPTPGVLDCDAATDQTQCDLVTGCASKVLATMLEDPNGIAVDDEHVYWTLDNPMMVKAQLFRAAHDGKGAEPMLADGTASEAEAVVVDDVNAYVADDAAHTILRVSKDATSAAPAVVASDLGYLRALLAAPEGIYFANNDGGGSVGLAPAGGGAPVKIGELNQAQALALDKDYLYWVESGDFDQNNGRAMRARRKDLGAPTLLADGLNHPASIAVDATDAYVATDDAIVRLPKSGGTPETVATDQGGPRALAFSHAGLFWGRHNSNTKGGGVALLPPGAAEEVLVYEGDSPERIALACSGIYFTQGGQGQVVRLTRD